MAIKIKYSIIIPAYNATSYIEKCLNSILEQKCNNFEIIIVNDGSTDNTLHVLNEYAKQYSNIIIFSQENAGPGAARELALKSVSGDYIIFSDADDYWENNFLTGIDKNIEKWSPDILEFGYRKVALNGEIISDNQMIFMKLTNENCVNHYVRQKNTTNYLWNKVFSRKIFRNVEFPRLYAGEDAAVLLQLFSNAESYVSVSDIYYNYIMTPTSLCRLPFSTRRLDILGVIGNWGQVPLPNIKCKMKRIDRKVMVLFCRFLRDGGDRYLFPSFPYISVVAFSGSLFSEKGI